MIKIIDSEKINMKDILNREIQSYTEYENIVRDIIYKVRTNGDESLKEFALNFDKVKLEDFVVTEEEFKAAEKKVDASLVEVIKKSAANIREFHTAQARKGFELNKDGIVLGQKISPIENVGIYVPGGTASYPSTVLMNAIPAKIAGVPNIYMCTPPQKDGSVKAEILVAAKIAGVDKVFKVGGAGAVAAFAYGTNTIPKVDKIVGPGNIFVALAKKEVFGTVGIDMVAGPTEILVVADDSANPVYVAADILSQAEHDKLATPVLVTNSEKLAKAVQEQIDIQLKELPRYEIANTSIENNGKIILAKDLDKVIDIANAIAPEHLELCIANPMEMLTKIKNAGSVFLGNYTPESLGDYFAGPNHTLPTSGSARFSSALGVDDFVKKTQYIYYTREELGKVAKDIAEFANSEGLQGHAKAALIRFKGEE